MNNDTPITHARPKRRTRNRISKHASAAATIKDFSHDIDVVGLTMGQFSLIDLISATLDITGPAHITICTWSTSFYDVEAIENFRDSGKFLSIRFIMDGVKRRGQADGVTVADVFGDEAIRTVNTHAKFVIIENEEWDVVITSSMNLNLNPRCEQFEMTDDADRCDMFRAFRDSVWKDVPAEYTRERKANLPALTQCDLVQDELPFEVGEIKTYGIMRQAG